MTDKHDTTQDDGSEAPIIAESAQFIEESTLIPPSSLNVEGDLSGESVQVIGESSAEPEIAAADAKPAKAKAEGKKLPLPLPLLAAGAAGVIVIAVIGVKLMGAGGAQQQAPQVAQIAPVKQQAPAVPTPRVEAPPPVQAPAVQPTPVDSVPATPVAPPITAVAPPVAPPVAQAPVDVKPANDAELRSLDSRTTSNTAEIVDLKQRVTALEQKSGTATSGAASSPVKGDAPKAVKRKPTAAEREAWLQKRTEREAQRQATAEREAKITRAASGYDVHSLKDNLAWLADSSGKVQSYNIGDTVPGVGKLTKINDRTQSVTAGGRVIR